MILGELCFFAIQYFDCITAVQEVGMLDAPSIRVTYISDDRGTVEMGDVIPQERVGADDLIRCALIAIYAAASYPGLLRRDFRSALEELKCDGFDPEYG